MENTNSSKASYLTKVEESVKKNISTRPIKHDRREAVILKDTKGFEQYVNSEYHNYETKNPYIPELKFSLEEFANYCYTIVESRVGWCVNKPVVVHPQSDIPVPALLVTALANVGVAENNTYGAVIVPKLATQVTINLNGVSIQLKSLTLDEMRRIGTWIKVYDPTGYSIGYPKDKRGEWALMTYFSREGSSSTDRVSQFAAENHLVYSLLSYFLGVNLEDNSAFYVSAGTSDELGEVLWRLIN